MRNVILLFTLTLFGGALIAQDQCDNYFPFKEGAVLEYKTLNGKGKLDQTTKQTILNVENGSDGISARVNSEMFDKKGKPTTEIEYGIACKDNMFHLDIKSLIPVEQQNMMGGQTNAEVEVNGDGFVLPNNVTVGQKLPDSENVVKMKMGPMNMGITINISEHVVEAKESLTTEAGTFDCIKVSYIADTKVMIAKAKIKVINWYAKGFGTVKTESYNAKNDKLLSTMLLSKYTK